MGILKGQRINGFFQVPEAVRFMKSVQQRYASPWGVSFFVDGVNGSDTNDGFTPENAKKTIQAAVTAASRGDAIYIRPNDYVVGTGFRRYTETITTALAQSDLYLIGVSNSPNVEYGPRLAKTSSGYNLDVYGPALHVENIGFFSEGATGTALLRNNGATNTRRGTDGTTFYNCVIKGGKIITADGGDGTTIKNCMFHGSAGVTGGINAVGSANPGRRLRILNSIFQEGNGAAVDTAYITILGVYSEILIDKCRFGLIPTDGHFIYITSSTGLISNSQFQHADMTIASTIIQGGTLMVNCHDVAGLAL